MKSCLLRVVVERDLIVFERSSASKWGACPNDKTARRRLIFSCFGSVLEGNLERAKGLEPSTPTLARSCSTTELHPHPKALTVQIAPATAVLCQMRTANATV